jgi:type II secretory ATPase GspE/PulE/Tfp pilus assembly ATPase PilB-like protein
MVKKQDIIQDTDILKQEILGRENKKEYRSDRFNKIETQVKDALKRQATDDALRDISIGALIVGSSDIHYEAYEKDIIVRFRIDGILVDIFKLSHAEYKKIVERLKFASGLKLNISNIPQD